MAGRNSISPKDLSRRDDRDDMHNEVPIHIPTSASHSRFSSPSGYNSHMKPDTLQPSNRYHSDLVDSRRRPSQAHPGWQNSLLLSVSFPDSEPQRPSAAATFGLHPSSALGRLQSRKPTAVAAGIYSNIDPAHLPPRRPSVFENHHMVFNNPDPFLDVRKPSNSDRTEAVYPHSHSEHHMSQAVRQRSKLTNAIISQSQRPSAVSNIANVAGPDSAYRSRSEYDSRRSSELDELTQRDGEERSMYQIGDSAFSDDEDDIPNQTLNYWSGDTNSTLQDHTSHGPGAGFMRFGHNEHHQDHDPDAVGHQSPQPPMLRVHSPRSSQVSYGAKDTSFNSTPRSTDANPFHIIIPDPPTHHTQPPIMPPIPVSIGTPPNRFSISSTFSRKSSLAKARYVIDLNGEQEKRNPYGFHPTNTFENLEETIPTLSTRQVHDYPEGGRDAWCTLAGSCLVLFSTFGNVAAFGVYQDYYTRFFLSNSSPSAVSWIGSMQLFLLFSTSLFSARAMNQGYFRHCMLGGAVLYLGSSLAMSFTHRQKYYQLMLSQGVGKGLGLGLMFLPSILITCQYFLNNRPFIMAIKVTSAGVGSIFFPIFINHTLGLNHSYIKADNNSVGPSVGQTPPDYQYDEGIGFGWSTRASFFVHLALLVIANILMKERERSKWNQDLVEEKQNRGMGVSGGGGGGNGRGLGFGDWFGDLMALSTDVTFGLSVAGAFLAFWGGLFPLFYVQLFSTRLNLRGDVAFYTLTILNASSLIGRIVPNVLCDKFGTYVFMIPSAFLTSILIFAMFGLKGGERNIEMENRGSAGGLVIWLVIYGIISGAFFSLTFPLFTSLTSDFSELGFKMSIGFTVLGLAALTGPPVAGALLTSNYDWSGPILFSAFMPLAGTALLTIAGLLVARKKKTYWV